MIMMNSTTWACPNLWATSAWASVPASKRSLELIPWVTIRLFCSGRKFSLFQKGRRALVGVVQAAQEEAKMILTTRRTISTALAYPRASRYPRQRLLQAEAKGWRLRYRTNLQTTIRRSRKRMRAQTLPTAAWPWASRSPASIPQRVSHRLSERTEMRVATPQTPMTTAPTPNYTGSSRSTKI